MISEQERKTEQNDWNGGRRLDFLLRAVLFAVLRRFVRLRIFKSIASLSRKIFCASPFGETVLDRIGWWIIVISELIAFGFLALAIFGVHLPSWLIDPIVNTLRSR